MAAVDTLWAAELKRDQLLDIVQGKANSLQPLPPDQFADLSPRKGVIIAIWRASSSVNRSPLPQVIVGDPPTLEDLFAWSASYLRGIGPITAQTRVISPHTLHIVLNRPPENLWAKLASGAVGAVLGEVLMHSRRVIPFAGITLAAYRGTLSFALMRAAALGIRAADLLEVGELWEQLRAQTGQASTIVPAGAIAQVSMALATARLDTAYNSPNDYNRWFTEMLSGGGVPALLRGISAAFSPLPKLSLEGFTELTAEERVKLFDSLAPILISHPTRSQVEKAFTIALMGYLCRAGMAQQATLLAPFSTTVPESLLWLGVMQAAVPFTDTLAEGDGLGWRVARELFQPGDIFSPPTSDIALSELQILARGRASTRMIKALAKARLDVELLPGVSTFVRILQPDTPEQPALPLQTKTPGAENLYDGRTDHPISEELLLELEKTVSNLSRFIRGARASASGGGAGDRKRRR